MKVRRRAAGEDSAAQAFLARHNSARAARLGELVEPLHYAAFLAEDGHGRLIGMITYVPDRDWKQCEVLTLRADEQWHGVGTALVEAVRQLARQQGCTRFRPAEAHPPSAMDEHPRAVSAPPAPTPHAQPTAGCRGLTVWS